MRWPFAYHVTDHADVAALARNPVLQPTADLLIRAGDYASLRIRREEPMPILVDSQQVVLKDQRPLILANSALTDGRTSGDFIEFLNRHVFFWPGHERGPIRRGRLLLQRYAAAGPAMLRTPTADLFATNPELEPRFCPFNSGALRKQHGRRVRRGPDLFMPAEQFPRKVSQVVELVFKGPVHLGAATEVRVL